MVKPLKKPAPERRSNHSLHSVAEALGAVRVKGGTKPEYRCACPAHRGDSKDSLQLFRGDKMPIAVKCWAGCSAGAINDAVAKRTGIELFAINQPGKHTLGRPVVVAEYEHSTERRTVVKGEPAKPAIKRAMRTYDKQSGSKLTWGRGSNDGLHVLFWRDGQYRQDLPEASADAKRFKWQLYANVEKRPVVVGVEGEKPAAILSQYGVDCFTWAGGTSSVDKCCLDRLKGLFIVLWADRDQPGQKAMWKMSERLKQMDIPHVVLAEAGGDGFDAADFEYDEIMRRLRMPTHWQAIQKKVPDLSAEDKESGARQHPPRKPLVVETSYNRKRQALRCILGQIGLKFRQNGRTHEYEEYDADAKKWQQVTHGWLERKLPDARQACVQWTKKGWGDADLSMPRAKDELAALGHEGVERDPHNNDDVKEWLQTLPAWDQQHRIHLFLSEAFGCKATDLNQWASASLFMQIVRRTLEPGCHWRGVVVLSGDENGGKSLLVRYLMPEHLRQYAVVLDFSKPTKEVVQDMQGFAVGELAELAGLTRKSWPRLKAFLTTYFDRIRLSYRRDSQNLPRTGAFIATKNPTDEMLYDKSGATRWVVVECPQRCIVQEFMEREGFRQQLFAEAMALYEAQDERFLFGIPLALEQHQHEQNLEHVETDDEMAAVVDELWENGCNGKTLLEMAMEGRVDARDF